MAEFKIGDIVDWEPLSDGFDTARRDLGPGPFRLIGKSNHYHAVNLDGSPLAYDDVADGPPHQRYYLVAESEIRKNVFLTSVMKALEAQETR